MAATFTIPNNTVESFAVKSFDEIAEMNRSDMQAYIIYACEFFERIPEHKEWADNLSAFFEVQGNSAVSLIEMCEDITDYVNYES